MLNDLLMLLAVAGLIAINGFFVAAEFALVSVRPTRIDSMAADGNWSAGIVQKALADPNRFISACQVGITMASLALGWIAEPAIASLVDPLLEPIFGETSAISSHLVAAAFALILVTLLHIVIGEQVPKMIAIQRSMPTVLRTAPVVQAVSIPFRPLIAVLYWLTEIVLGWLGLAWEGEHSLVYTEDELKMLVTASRKKGLLDESEEAMIEKIFSFGDIETDEVMIPRTEMMALPATATASDIADLVAETGHTRFPVYGEDLDDLVGVFHTRDMVSAAIAGNLGDFSMRRFIKPAVFVSDHTPLDELLTIMKDRRTHMAVVVDEYGGTAGMVTLEDVLEHIVGDVGDQFDSKALDAEQLDDGTVRVSGLLGIDEVNERFGTHIEDTYYNSIGGYLFGQLGRKAEIGDKVAANGHQFVVAGLDGLRIDRVDINETAPASENGDESGRAESDAESLPAVADEQS